MRADAAIGIVEGQGTTQQGFGTQDYGYGADASVSVGGVLGKGTVGRRMAIIWGASAVWLLLVWRAVEGY